MISYIGNNIGTNGHQVLRSSIRHNGGKDVLFFEIGIIRQNLIVRSSRAQQLQDVRHPHPHATNAWTTAAFPRLDRDALEQFNIHALTLAQDMWANKPHSIPARARFSVGMANTKG
jgi:hypothetical protein